MSRGAGEAGKKEARPTSGIVMGALFNILGDLRGRSFLDLFSGTGRVAARALDLGASPVYAVESIRARSDRIRAMRDWGPSFNLVAMDARRALSMFRRRGARFDVVFADPPYGAGWPAVLGELLFTPGGGVVERGGVVAVEHSTREEVLCGSACVLLDSRSYGDTALSFLGPAAAGEALERGDDGE